MAFGKRFEVEMGGILINSDVRPPETLTEDAWTIQSAIQELSSSNQLFRKSW